MNSLVSPTKVITNDAVPNRIISTQCPIPLPTIPVQVTSIGIPIMTMKNDNNIVNKSTEAFSNAEAIDTEDDKLCDNRKIDEPMPVEDDQILEIANKIEDNIVETDIEVIEVVENSSEHTKNDDTLIIEPANKTDDLIATNDHLSIAEPMECASVNSMASPKHIMATDVIMTESVSVSTGSNFFIVFKNPKMINLSILFFQ